VLAISYGGRKMKKTAFITVASASLLILAGMSQATFAFYPSPNPWPMWRYDQQHSAYTTSSVTSRNITIWDTSTYYYPADTPIVVDGKVIFGGTGNKMYALDETTGVELWKSSPALSGSLIGSPAYSNGFVFVGTSSGYLYCINATNGAKLWENQLSSTGQIAGAPTVANGKVYATTTDIGSPQQPNVFGCDVSTGQYGNWYYQAGGRVYTSPAVYGNMVYFGCDDGKVYALDTSNPGGFVTIWRYQTSGQVRSSPSVGDGKVFIGSYSTDRAVFALNATTTNPNGQLIWKYTLDQGYQVDSTPAYYNGVVYFTSYNGKVYALNANASPGSYTENQPGCKIWSQTIGGSPGGNSPAIADGKLLASDGNNEVYCLNATDGHVIWSSLFAQAPGEPVVADGNVFVVDYYYLHCIGDYYPPITYYYTVTPPGAGGNSFNIKLVVANATPSQTIETGLLVSLKKLSYNVTGIDGTMGMSNITLPDNMLGGQYTVRVNGGLIPSPTVVDDGNYSSIYFTYFQSLNSIEITGTTVVAEFTPIILAPILVAMTLITVLLAKRKTQEE
jgi:outer membrane protein assembly factor BamB